MSHWYLAATQLAPKTTLTVDSAPAEGATFEVFLPRVHQDPDSDTVRDEIGDLPTGGETVLLVEDEPAVRDAVGHTLRGQGYTVIEASNGLEALKIAEDREPDEIRLLITDVVMPVMGGAELAEKLHEERPIMKVLFVSGYVDDLVINRVIQKEWAEYMQKPFTPSALAHNVRATLDL